MPDEQNVGGTPVAPHSPPRFLALMGIVGMVLVALAMVREGPRRAGGEEPMDFVQYYYTGWCLDRGLPAYETIKIDGALARELGWSHSSPMRTANPPAMVCLTWPLAQIPYPVAWWALSLSSLAMLAGGSWIAARHAGWGRAGALAWAALAAGSTPTLAFLVLNHIEAPILILGVAGWILIREGRARSGAALWGLAAALKLFPAFWLLTLWRLRDRGAAFVGFAVAATFTALGMAAVGWQDTLVFFREALPQSGAWQSDTANMSIRSFGTEMLGDAGGITLTACTAILILAMIFRGSPSPDRLWCLGLLGSLLLSPLSWSYYLVLAAPVAALVFSRLDLVGGPGRMMFATLISAIFFWPSLLGRWMPGIEAAEALGLPWTMVRHAPTLALATLAWLGHRHLAEAPAAVDPVTPAAAAGS